MPLIHDLSLLPSTLLVYLVFCLQPTHAQTVSSTLSNPTGTSITSSSSTRSRTWVTQTTTFTHLTNLPTLSSPSASTTQDPTIPGLPPTTGAYGRPALTPEDQKRDSLVNLYFVFLLLIIVLVGLVLWIYLRRKKSRLLAARDGRRDALERDLSSRLGEDNRGEGFFSRGFFSAGARAEQGRRRWLPSFGREEGLDERGEAPPPYKPRLSAETVVLREVGKPPDYEERAGSVGSPTVGGSTLRGSGEVGRSGSARSGGSTIAEGRT
ncbi:hypothetical protein CAC42_1829 [Sphaceloma murrayae]|uniref:Uncharacterized protein n=1 Tax=Sphaceloma murrayae TaxID=2082308 RepID=A0A2K1QW21_9PEZI|nr:hypothetical protein CAC42_1829 [Sphaceloma murrayae]